MPTRPALRRLNMISAINWRGKNLNLAINPQNFGEIQMKSAIFTKVANLTKTVLLETGTTLVKIAALSICDSLKRLCHGSPV